MKKLVLEQEERKIHIGEISGTDIIIIKQKGEIVGTIVNDSDDYWFATLIKERNEFSRDLSKVLKWEQLKGCEFYVLE